ncbi:hypothetical protein ASD65_03080 [Microbacterium sp. Root61]|nr:hypothetical protein ASD65_03080 [Microbacterium sp. Root61]
MLMTEKRVIEVFRSNNSDETNAVAAEGRARGERIIEDWREAGIVVLRFEGMTEPEILAWLDETWEARR